MDSIERVIVMTTNEVVALSQNGDSSDGTEQNNF